jgi:hypothetical protein
MASYRFLDDVAIADVAFEARARSLGDLFAPPGGPSSRSWSTSLT